MKKQVDASSYTTSRDTAGTDAVRRPDPAICHHPAKGTVTVKG